MTIQRVITRVTMTCWEEPSGFVVQQDIRFVESDIAGGRQKTETVRYDRLSEHECRDVIEAISRDDLPGAEYGVQMAMFTLS